MCDAWHLLEANTCGIPSLLKGLCRGQKPLLSKASLAIPNQNVSPHCSIPTLLVSPFLPDC